jgi:hypothetical protein
MNDQRAVVADADPLLEALAAELTAAAYPVALRHAVVDEWLDLQLELWRALTDAVKKLGGARHEPGDTVMPVPPFQMRAKA